MSDPKVVHFSNPQNPTSWEVENAGVIEFASSAEAKKAESLFRAMQADVDRAHEALQVAAAASDQTVEAALAADREAALRDVFAAAALGALILRHPGNEGGTPWLPAEAYRFADAMLKARKR